MKDLRFINTIYYDSQLIYPITPPYAPSESYPEYDQHISNEKNLIYEAIRNMFMQMKLDESNIGTKYWNPLGDFIKPGQSVLIKPNWVMHSNPNENTTLGLITHPSVIRVICDYVLKALKGEGKLIIGDAPLQTCNLPDLLQKSGVLDTVYYLKERSEVLIEIKDFRLFKAMYNPTTYTIKDLVQVNSEENFLKVDLKDNSSFHEINDYYKQYRVTNYDKSAMQNTHNKDSNQYLINKDVIDADVIINMPKFKTHRKAGLTCCLKNMIGINGHKDWLPHHRSEPVEKGGDNYDKSSLIKYIYNHFYEKEFSTNDRTKKLIYRILKQLSRILMNLTCRNKYFEGSWYGNDTIWRTTSDLNTIVKYCDKNGKISASSERIIINVVDAVEVGEREGPLEPTYQHFGTLAIGENSVEVDMLMSQLAGFDYTKIPTIYNIGTKTGISEDFKVLLNNKETNFKDVPTIKKLVPSLGWAGHINRD